MEDKEALRHLYRGFALCGLLMNGDYGPQTVTQLAKELGDAMLEENEPSRGLSSLKKKHRYDTD